MTCSKKDAHLIYEGSPYASYSAAATNFELSSSGHLTF